MVSPAAIAREGQAALDRARVAFEEAPRLTDTSPEAQEAVRASMVARLRDSNAHMNSLIREAKGGNPRKLISERDLHAVALARLDRGTL